jgi:hypothetical protein
MRSAFADSPSRRRAPALSRAPLLPRRCVDPAHYNTNDNHAYYCEASAIYNQATTSGGSVVADYGSPGVNNPPCQ